MADNTTVVKCPCCRGELYRYVHLEGGAWTTSKDSPPFQKDKRGHFIVCTRCSKRVDFLILGSDSKGRHVFQMAREQPC